MKRNKEHDRLLSNGLKRRLIHNKKSRRQSTAGQVALDDLFFKLLLSEPLRLCSAPQRSITVSKHLLLKQCSKHTPTTTTTTTILWTFVWDYPGEPVQKKHSLSHHPDHHPIFISFFHLPWSIASSLFKLRAWQSFCSKHVTLFSPASSQACISKFPIIFSSAGQKPFLSPNQQCQTNDKCFMATIQTNLH